jgi:hypothetical protein
MAAGGWIDIDAPDTNWRPSSEDPIPLAMGRAGWLGFLYRLFSCRPLDGHARTDAGFLRAGTKCYTKSGHTLPFNYWPGWKRGALVTRGPAFLLLAALAVFAWPVLGPLLSLVWQLISFVLPLVGRLLLAIHGALGWLSLVIEGAAVLLLAWWIRETISSLRRWRFERDYLSALRGALVSYLKTRDGISLSISREMVGASSPGPTGRIGLPPAHPMAEGDRDRVMEIVQGRLGSAAIDGRFNMEGSKPHLELYVPQQPPKILTWEEIVERADVSTPYLGQSASGGVHWEPTGEMPHIAVVGKTGSGKTELMSFAVAQFMRGGAGLLVIDIKGFSHEWAADIPGVHYARSPQGIHDALIWLEGEMYRRINERVQRRQFDFPRLVVIMEERNSTQEALRAHWQEVKPAGMTGKSPAIRAIDAVLSQARAVNINVIMAGQETAEPKVGAKVNYGAWAISGRMERNHWRNVGADRKPAINTTRPGRWGWVVGGQVTVFQAAFPDLANHYTRLRMWAQEGEERFDVTAAMQYVDSVSPPWSEPVAADEDRTPTAFTPEPPTVTLREFSEQCGMTISALRSKRDRDASFPKPVASRGQAQIYNLLELDAWFGQQG